MTKGFDSYYSTVATIISNCGAVTYAFYSSELAPFIAYSCLLFRLPFLFCVNSGGIIAGTVSQYIGRRLTIIIFAVFAGAFIPLWILPNTFSVLSAGAFWLQFGLWGAWGVIPIYLAEIAHPDFAQRFLVSPTNSETYDHSFVDHCLTLILLI